MSGDSSRYIVEVDELTSFTKEIFDAIGLSDNNATIFTESLIDANLRGKDSHGIVRLPHYVERIESGGMQKKPDVSVEQTSASTVVINGDGGPGQVASQTAVETGVEVAADQGACVVGVINSNHFGTASYYTNQAAEDGFVGICISHGGPIVIPYGGTEKQLSTNPISIGVPHEPFTVNVDFATSAAALGNIFLAENKNENIPSDWAIDQNGEPTTDPAEFFALRPMAGHKGYGLSFLIDVLCGVMLSGQFGSEVSGLYDNIETPQELAHLFIFIDIESFVPLEVFGERLKKAINSMKGTPVRESADVNEVMIPGERAHDTKQERLEEGIPIQSEVWKDLIKLSESYSVSLPSTKNI